MGKRILVQRRGRGSATFKAHATRKIAPVKYPPLSKEEMSGVLKGRIARIFHESGRGTPLGLIEIESGTSFYTVLPEGTYEGQQIEIGKDASLNVGNTLPLKEIPEGTMVCNVELTPGSGGKLARSSGSFVTIVDHTPEGTLVKLPSGKTKYVNSLCRATVGVVAGGGQTEKPFLKAGTKYYLMKAKGRVYPRTRGIAMIAASHPYGSSKRGGRKVTTVSRGAPPGKKVGLIAARGTGRKRRRRR